VLTAVSIPRAAHAHAGERGFVLLLPTEYYLVGGTLAVAASVALLAVVPAGGLARLAGWRASLFKLPKVPVTITSWASFLFLCWLVGIGLTGTGDPLGNPLPLSVWTLWWVGFTLLVAILGNLWRLVNPWSGPYRTLSRIARAGPLLPYPQWLDHWPAALIFFAFAWFELIYPSPDDPAVLARVVAAYWGLTFAAMLLFGEQAWLGRAEPFSVLFRYLGGLSPLRFEDLPSQRRRLYALVIPGKALIEREPLPASGVLLILLALASVSFDGLSRTFWWLGLGGINPLEHPGRTALMTGNTFGLLLCWAALASIFWLCTGRRAGRLVFTIVPIALGYHFSHYLTQLLVNGQYALSAFGLLEGHVTTSFLNNREGVTVIWNLQAGSIVICHVLAVVMARLVHAQEPGLSRLAEVPLAAAMVLYTLFGLWLVATPVAA
jgi:hypothetical protein